jgi:hypothetical protein
MDEEIRRAIFEIRDLLKEIRQIFLDQKKQAGDGQKDLKAQMAKVMEAAPPGLRDMFKPLMKG